MEGGENQVGDFESISGLDDKDINIAEMLWIKVAQQNLEDAKSQNLAHFVEENGIVR